MTTRTEVDKLNSYTPANADAFDALERSFREDLHPRALCLAVAVLWPQERTGMTLAKSTHNGCSAAQLLIMSAEMLRQAASQPDFSHSDETDKIMARLLSLVVVEAGPGAEGPLQ